jgi:hypothetical protein
MALTQHEEKVLRQLARDHSPMEVMNPCPAVAADQLSDGQCIGRLLDRAVKMTVVGGTGAKENPVALEKTAAFRRKGECLMQFHSRTGISLWQVLNLPKDELARAVKVSEESPEGWVPSPLSLPPSGVVAPIYRFVQVGD